MFRQLPSNRKVKRHQQDVEPGDIDMRAFSLSLASVVMGVVVGATAAQAAPGVSSPKADQCFYSSQFQGFRAINDHSFYMRAGVNDIYRIDLSGSCPVLQYPDARLITVVRGSNLICGPLDWDLRVAQGGPGGMAEPCIVSAQTRMTKEEAAAIPPKLRP
jgi:hypothetical protein